ATVLCGGLCALSVLAGLRRATRDQYPGDDRMCRAHLSLGPSQDEDAGRRCICRLNIPPDATSFSMVANDAQPGCLLLPVLARRPHGNGVAAPVSGCNHCAVFH